MNDKSVDVKVVNGIRFYETPVGFLPSVTSVLGHTQNIGKVIAISKWKAKMGEEAAKIYVDKCIARGNAFHSAIENYFENAIFSELLNPIAELLESINSVVSFEQPSYHTYGYAGRSDCVLNINNKNYVIDWKTSTKKKTKSMIGDYCCQVAAYSQSIYKTHGTVIDGAKIVIIEDGKPDAKIFTIEKEEMREWWFKFYERLLQFQAKFPLENI